MINNSGWQQTLDALAFWLAAEEVKGVSATVTVSNCWVRFALAPWSAAVSSEVEENSFARACLESVYGDLTGWAVVLGPSRYGQSRIVCALETAFLDQLRTILQKHKIACRSVHPYFMLAQRQGRFLLSGQAGILAVAESGTVVLASVQQRRWHSLRSVRCELSPATLTQLLEREVLLQGFPEAPTLAARVPGMAQAKMSDGHGKYATPDDETRHTHFPFPDPLPQAGEGGKDPLREFHDKVTLLKPETLATHPVRVMALEAAASSARMPVDFAPKGFSIGRTIGLLGFLAAVGVACWSGWHYLQLQQKVDIWQADWQRLHRNEVQPHAVSTPEDLERVKSELRFANRVIEKLDTPWDALFGAVEEAFNEQVTLLSVEPDTERREVRLLAEAKNLGAMLDYVQQVRESPVLKNGYLVEHQINQQDPLRPVRFTVTAGWLAHLPVNAKQIDPVDSDEEVKP
ncbi:MAG: hypothetical protein EPN14_05770 [Gallionella sp.]|nr:MAG: hypothetical protein EPN14_05770 [Gallionella sp.]